MSDSRGFFAALVGDGRSLISFSGLCLALAGGFALFQSTTGDFLPHDVRFLQMSADELCGINECRIVHFMVHDRVSFGGALIAIGVLYLWLAEFPLRAGEAWAWWILAISGLTGFGSFLAYLGYGYLDTWHGVATLTLLPCFVGGMWKARTLLSSDRATRSWRTLLRPASWPNNSALVPLGRSLLLLSACGMIAGGATIHYVGATEVFVPTDLTFMGIERSQFDAINPRLVPLIAHDRAGFGGAVATAGLLVLATVWCGTLSPSMRQALATAGLAGWSTAIFVHPLIGYNDAWHLAPAVTGAALYFAGLFLTLPARPLASESSAESHAVA